jgi:hypothetical protein
MHEVCFTLAESYGAIAVAGFTAVISVASALANIISKDTIIGKFVHLCAVNIKVK